MADTNQLYQNIAASAEDVKNTYAGLPTFETNIRENLVAPDVTLNSALGGYTDKVAELFAHDKQIADNWSTSQVPTNLQPEGFMEDPYAKSMASASLYSQKGDEAAKALNLYEKRKNFLGNIVDKALKVYEAAIKGKELDYKKYQGDFDNAISLMNAETSRMNAVTSASAHSDEKTQKERFKKEALSQIEERAAQGASIGQLFDEFASSGAVEMKDVMDTYKKVNYYKKQPEESSDRLARAWESASQGLGHADILGNLSAAERAIIQPKTAVVSQLNLVMDRMKELSGGDPNFLDNFSTGQFGMTKSLNKKFGNDQVLKQIIARITAKDRQDIFGSALTEPEQKIAKDWLAGYGDLPNELWSKILAASIANKANIDSVLLGRVSKPELDAYWDRQKQLQMALGGSTVNTANSVNDSDITFY